MKPQLHPLTEELRCKCAEHRRALRECLGEWHRLTTQERPCLLEKYHKEFGNLELYRQHLVLRCAESRRRLELLYVKVNRGESLTAGMFARINELVNSEFSKMYGRLAKAEQMNATRNAGGQPTVAGHAEINSMYRTLAKKYHPDVTGETDSVQEWHDIQTAYRHGDASRLRALLTLMEADEPAALEAAQESYQDLVDTEARLAARRRIEERKLRRLLSEEPFALRDQLSSETWITEHRLKLQKEIATCETAIAEYEQSYAQIASTVGVSTKTPTVEPTTTEFDKEFFDNTYFGGR